MADDARADRRGSLVDSCAREPDKADLRMRKKQIERPRERFLAAVAIRRARRQIVGVALQEYAEQRFGIGARRGRHP